MCTICDRIELIRQGTNPYFVREYATGYAVIGDHQNFRGYTLFLCKQHKRELHELDPDFRRRFLWEMSEVAAAVLRAFKPRKLNYELLGNSEAHLHWHLFPRHDDSKEPVWTVLTSTLPVNPASDELGRLKAELAACLPLVCI